MERFKSTADTSITSSILTVPLLAVVVVGPLLAFDESAWSLPVLAAWVLCSAAASAFVFKFRRIGEGNLWVWVVIFLFLFGHFAKSAFIYDWIVREGDLSFHTPEWKWISEAEILRAYVVSALAFAVFVGGVLLTRPEGAASGRHPKDIHRRRARLALVLCMLAIAALSLMRAMLGIGIMGVETEQLPLGLDTLIFRTQSVVLPALLAVLIWIGIFDEDHVLYRLSLGTLATHFIALAAVSASKAGVIHFLILSVFLWLCSGTFSVRRGFVLATLGFAAILFYVFGTELRLLRIEGLTFAESLEAVTELGFRSVSASFNEAMRAIFLRVTGADGLWFVVGVLEPGWFDLRRIGSIADQTLVEFYTRDVVGVVWLQDFRAPGFVAAFLMLFGYSALLLVVLLVPVLSHTWSWLGRSDARVPLRAYFAAFLLQFLMEGVFRWQDLAATAFGGLAIVGFVRWLRGGDLRQVLTGLQSREGRVATRFGNAE